MKNIQILVEIFIVDAPKQEIMFYTVLRKKPNSKVFTESWIG